MNLERVDAHGNTKFDNEKVDTDAANLNDFHVSIWIC